jgi:hypothetical protein
MKSGKRFIKRTIGKRPNTPQIFEEQKYGFPKNEYSSESTHSVTNVPPLEKKNHEPPKEKVSKSLQNNEQKKNKKHIGTNSIIYKKVRYGRKGSKMVKYTIEKEIVGKAKKKSKKNIPKKN